MRITKITISLLVLICAYIIVNLFWLKINNIPPAWDVAMHAHISIVFSKYIHSHGFWSLFFSPNTLLINPLYPPFISLAVIPFYNLFPVKDIGSMTLAMDIVFLPILVFSVFGIGKRMGDEKTGFFSAYLVAVYPFTIVASRYFILEFPLMAMVALMIYVFILSDDFQHTIFSLLFGMVMGIGLLLKQSFILFTLPIIAYSLARVYLRRREKVVILKQAVNLSIILFACILLCGWWYAYNVASSFDGYKIIPYYCKLLNPRRCLLHWDKAIQFYPKALLTQISYPFIIAFFLSLPLYIKSRTKYKYLPVFFIIGVIFIHTFVFTKDPRYIIAIFTGFALITASGLFSIANIYLRRLAIWLVVSLSLLNFYEMASGKALTKLFTPSAGMSWVYSIYNPYIDNTDWKIDKVIFSLKEEISRSKAQKEKLLLVTGINHKVYSFQTIRYYAEAENLDLEISGLQSMNNPVDFLKNRQYDLLLYKDKNNVGKFETNKINKVGAFLKTHPRYLKAVSRVKLPDESTIILYRCQRLN